MLNMNIRNNFKVHLAPVFCSIPNGQLIEIEAIFKSVYGTYIRTCKIMRNTLVCNCALLFLKCAQ